MTDSPTDPIVGIDLGTTNSLVAYFDQAGPRVLNSPEGESLLPSVVRVDEQGKVEAVGSGARAHAVEFPQRTINSVKRLMGRSRADLDTEELSRLGYDVIEGPHDTARVRVGEAVLSPPEVSAHVLAELKRWAEAALDRPVKRAVVTVPAYFDDAQRQATRDAGRLAGLEVVRIVNEPTAAALAYGGAVSAKGEVRSAKNADGSVSLSTKLNPEACTSSGEPSRVDSSGGDIPGSNTEASSELIAVYDLGGGTFDISVLRLERDPELGAVDQVLATAGDTHLGGDDFDQLLIESIEQQAREASSTEGLSFTPSTRQALRQAAEAAKITLSTQDEAKLELELETADGESHTVHWSMTRGAFESAIAELIARTLKHCDAALRNAGVSASDVDRVVLVGGSTRVPAVQSSVEKHFGQRPYTALDPDRVVAMGAAVQAAVIAGIQRDRLLLDVIPLSLGIETLGGAVAKVIPANSTIPARASESFSTYVDGQTKVAINIYQGERELVADCRLLGRFDLTGIPPMPAGFPKLKVTFLVDANGILTVEAIEERSGRRADVQVAPSHGLTREEVERIENDSFAHAKQDMEAHRRIDLVNQARMDLRAIEQQLERVGDQLESAERETIESAIGDVRTFIDDPAADNEAFSQRLTAMDHASVRLAELAIAQTLREAAS